ncbi:MAG: heme-binding protein, partial [Ignavibacteriae bacterium]|nr:heme-binding protein [Ignavibacteriota bacterium]
GTQLGSIEVSIEKAKTALLFKRPTKVFQERIEQGANAMIGLRNALPLEGGLPFIVDGEIVGSIGVSGASSAQDGVIANAAVNFLISLK